MAGITSSSKNAKTVFYSDDSAVYSSTLRTVNAALDAIGAPGDGILMTTGTLEVDFNTTNLKMTGAKLNTIQNITTTSTVTFGNLIIGSTSGFISPGLGFATGAGNGSHVIRMQTTEFLIKAGNSQDITFENTATTVLMTIANAGDVDITNALTIGSDVTIYEASADASPEIRLGSSDAEELHIQAVYDSSAQTLNYVLLQTDVASASANKGLFKFNVDGTDILDIDDGGIDFDANMGISISGTDIITDSSGTATLSNIDALDATTEATIEAAIDTLANLTTASSLVTIGTLTSLTVNASSITLSQDTDFVISGGINGMSIDGTTFSVDGLNNRVGIGTSTPESPLALYANDTSVTAGGLTIEQDGTGDANCEYVLTGTRVWVTGIDNSDSDKFKIASSGDLNTDAHFVIDISGNVTLPTGDLSLADNTLHMEGAGDLDDTNGISFFDSNDDYKIGFDNVGGTKGYIRFNVDSASSANHGFIFSAGDLSAGTETDYMLLTTEGNLGLNKVPGVLLDATKNHNGSTVFILNNSGNSTPFGQIIDFSAASPDDNTQYFLRCLDSTTDRLLIYSDGDVLNHDGTYGTISDRDLKLESSIVDASPKTEDLLALKVRNYERLDKPGFKMIGFVAQEMEEVFPGLVIDTGHTVTNEDTKQEELIGTIKAVKTSILIPILVKGFQELESRISKLEAA